ncbi:MAG: hypothetical protein JRN20_03250 [Nitrososphaerota archaeon]|nr:hypothetical protein [Nitrososphaerota archaeon]MDG6923650.1 hypothetical protein [Nitrososphaerota archaeon]
MISFAHPEDSGKTWDELASRDPLWSILTWPEKHYNKWGIGEFFANGEEEIQGVISHIRSAHENVLFGSALLWILDAALEDSRNHTALHFKNVIGVDVSSKMIELTSKYDEIEGKCKYVVNKRPDLKNIMDVIPCFFKSFDRQVAQRSSVPPCVSSRCVDLIQTNHYGRYQEYGQPSRG